MRKHGIVQSGIHKKREVFVLFSRLNADAKMAIQRREKKCIIPIIKGKRTCAYQSGNIQQGKLSVVVSVWVGNVFCRV
jgi:hypothetical protein